MGYAGAGAPWLSLTVLFYDFYITEGHSSFSVLSNFVLQQQQQRHIISMVRNVNTTAIATTIIILQTRLFYLKFFIFSKKPWG